MLRKTKIDNLSPKERNYKISDGGGLFLLVKKNGKKYWRFKYQFGEKERSLSIGRYPDVSLAEAREARRNAKELLRKNIDPSLQRQSEKQLAVFKHENTFTNVAKEWFDEYKDSWTPRHATKLWRRLEMHVIPYFGKRPLSEITPRELLTVIQKIQNLGATETAHRTLWACSSIFKYAVILGVTEHNPAINIARGLRPHQGKHYPVIPMAEIPYFLRALESVEARPQDKVALRLLMLTAVRTGELRHSRWSDVSLQTATLLIRPEVAKMKEAHIVPLSVQAIDALKELKTFSGHQEWLFPNPVKAKHPVMSENVINNVIADMGYKGRMVGHAFRSLFSTVLNEYEFNEEAIERQLAHRERNGVKAAYNRAKHLSKRRFMMQWWADYLDSSVGIQRPHVAQNLLTPPPTSPHPNFNGLGIHPAFYAPVPSAPAYGNHFQHIGQPQESAIGFSQYITHRSSPF